MSETNGAAHAGGLNFDDLTVQELAVRIAGKDYVLREASGEAGVQYRNRIAASLRYGRDGRPTHQAEGSVEAEPLLVSLCLFEVYEHAGERKQRPVPLRQVKDWPYRVQKALYQKCLDLSPDLKFTGTREALKEQIDEAQRMLSDMESEEASRKNSPGPTTAG